MSGPVVDLTSLTLSPASVYRRRFWSRNRRETRVVPVANVRARIAYVLLIIFGATIGMGFASVAAGWGSFDTVRTFITPLITAEVSLLGAVMGFYYATHQNEIDGIPKVSPKSPKDQDPSDQ
jgi:hypothetical protein